VAYSISSNAGTPFTPGDYIIKPEWRSGSCSCSRGLKRRWARSHRFVLQTSGERIRWADRHSASRPWLVLWRGWCQIEFVQARRTQLRTTIL